MGSYRLFITAAITLAALTVLALPLAFGAKLFLLTVGAFCAVFIAVDAGGRGKTFAALTIAALTLYLLVTAQRGFLLLGEAGLVGNLLGAALLVLPALGAWSMVREIIFGSRTQALAQELANTGELPEDTLLRSASGRIDRAAADAQFTGYAAATEADPQNWKNWFRLSLAYDASGDRKRARKAMRTAIALHRGKNPAQLSI